MRPGPFFLLGTVALAVLAGGLLYPGMLTVGIPILAIIAGVAVAATFSAKRRASGGPESNGRQQVHTSDRTVGPSS